MRLFERFHDRPTMRALQFSGVIVARLPESNHFLIENSVFACVSVGGTYAPIELDETYHQFQSIQNENRKGMYPPMENICLFRPPQIGTPIAQDKVL